jgi:UDP-GlcNAc:undecaprenyl-phosphate GlcNAc-1-phosphate transferase
VLLAISLSLSLLACLLTLRLGFATPDHRTAPDGRPVVFGGAIGPLAGLLVACFAGHTSATLLAAFFAFGLLGLLDDAVELPVGRKLLGQMLAALGVAAIGWVESGPEAALLLAPACLVLANGVNLVDVADGLAGGLACLALLSLADGAASAEAVLAAGTLGFLFFNWPKARMYLGDAGAMALGAALAAAAVQKGEPARAGLAGAPFLAEIALLIVLRGRAGIPFWRKSPDHMVMRLRRLLPNPALAVPLIWLWAALVLLAGQAAGALAGVLVLLVLPLLLVFEAIRRPG